MQEVSCCSCGYPIGAHGEEGEEISCPYCGQTGVVMVKKGGNMRGKVESPESTVSTGISGTGFDFWNFFAGLAVGTIFSAPILATTKAGQKYLSDLAEQKIRR